jgi:LysR family transcriptional regulator, carnitine catabolism transcriptional activator
MDLRQVGYVLAVVDEGGFTRGARAAHVAQPSLSQAVRAVERELGVELFQRAGRRVHLTAAGVAFVDAARAVVRDVATLHAAVDAVRGVVAGTLDLVALPTLAVDPLAALLGRYRRAFPGVTVRVAQPEDIGTATDLVQRGVSEVALTELPVAAALVTHPLEVQELVVVLPPGDPLGRGHGPLPLERLAGVALVATPMGTSTRTIIEHAFSGVAIRPDVRVEIDQREAILPLVLNGAGAGFLPRSLAAEAELRGASVRRLRPALTRPIGLAHRSGVLSPAARAFVDLATQPGRTEGAAGGSRGARR